MATRSTIWIKNDDETYDGIYCHWDGYLENNGVLLVENYQDKDKVRKLIELGSISSLHEEVDCPDGHSFDNPVQGVVVAYHRDRNEDLCVYRNIPFEQLDRYFEEYNYFFIGNRWKYTKNNKSRLLLVPKSKKIS